MRTLVLFLILFLCGWYSPSNANEQVRELDSLSALPVNILEPTPEMDPLPELVLNSNALKAGLLYDTERNTIVWAKDMDQAYPIASLTKMMVSLMVFESISDGTYRWETPIKVSRRASLVGGSTANIRANISYSLEALLKASMIVSANDATYQLAEFMGGTEEAFVNCMNERAEQLGMTNTRFYTSTGLPDPRSGSDNFSSPQDLLVLAKALMQYNRALEISGCSEDMITHGKRKAPMRNHNALVHTYPEVVDGLKTGYTNAARFCLVATSDMEGRRLISIALGMPTRNARDFTVSSMLNSYYDLLGMGKMEPITPKVKPKKNQNVAKKTGKKKGKMHGQKQKNRASTHGHR